VISTNYATDGETPLWATVFDSWSAPIPLTGKISDASVLKSFLGFTRLETINFDFSKAWITGSAYIIRKSYARSDVINAKDWPEDRKTYTTSVTPFPGKETTIEEFFLNQKVIAAGGYFIDNVPYNLKDGAIERREGVRVWIANSKRPLSAVAYDEYAVLFELDGKIYFGGLEKAGTRYKSFDGVDKSILLDYNIRLNSKAVASLKQAVKF
jgi:hypothetical protein